MSSATSMATIQNQNETEENQPLNSPNHQGIVVYTQEPLRIDTNVSDYNSSLATKVVSNMGILEEDSDSDSESIFVNGDEQEEPDHTAAENIASGSAGRHSLDANSFFSRHQELRRDSGPLMKESSTSMKSPMSPRHRQSSVNKLSTFYSFSKMSQEDDERRLEDIYEVEFNRSKENSMLTQQRKYPTNYVKTTKYTIWTFLPVNLFTQFRRFYNIYFLLAAVFALLETSLDPISEILPLCIVLTVTAVKDGLEDYKRHKSDKIANTQPYQVVRDGVMQTILNKDIVPGDIVYAVKGEKMPADILILSSSGEDGACFVDTVELDGETSLKRRAAVPSTQDIHTPQGISIVRGYVECELPNEKLNLFEGIVTLELPGKTSEILPISLDNLLLRGTFLRNTEFIYGAVIYAGSETKIFKNLKQTGLKFSTMERKLNSMILYIFALNVIILLMSMTFAYGSSSVWYLPPPNSSPKAVIGVLMVFFVPYTFVIPISVFVSMELVRIIQANFMQWDDKMESQEGKRMKVHNSNLNEDLGSIEYIFSDKTGTLTRNIMKLARWFVGTKEFNEQATPGSLLEFAQNTRNNELLLFARCVALCHGTLPVYEGDSQEPIYESQSPDEAALLNGMRENNVWLNIRTKVSMQVTIYGSSEKYEILRLLDFTSDRKCMSILVRNEEGKVLLFCKGADNKIIPRLNVEDSPHKINAVQSALHQYSVNGLRTLVMAYRELSDREYEKFSHLYDRAERALHNRKRKITKACEIIEQRLILLGCSAIEDKLQDQVPETIEYLLKADIRIWLLTGDKQETAIKIGKSSKLISADMNIMKLNVKSGPDCSDLLDTFMQQLEKNNLDHANALVVDGESLVFVLLVAEISTKFLSLATRCRSVIACRVTPLQKALIVRLVKKQLKKVTLSIGDGANDVSMIQEAHVGVGIEGMEGAQAVRASDYSFNEFRCLKRLISVHGRYSFLRMCNLIFYSFYKSIALIMVQFWFCFFNWWSGMLLYSDKFLTLWNILFTALPPIVSAVMDKDIDEDKIDAYPQLYRAVKNGKFWNRTIEFGWLLSALYHSAVILGVLLLTLSDVLQLSYSQQALYVSTMVLITVYGKFCLTNRLWVWPTIMSLLIGVFLFIISEYTLETIGWEEPHTFVPTHRMSLYYASTALAVVVCLLPDFLFKL